MSEQVLVKFVKWFIQNFLKKYHLKLKPKMTKPRWKKEVEEEPQGIL